MTKKSADLTNFWQEKKGEDMTKKIQISLIACIEDVNFENFRLKYTFGLAKI